MLPDITELFSQINTNLCYGIALDALFVLHHLTADH